MTLQTVPLLVVVFPFWWATSVAPNAVTPWGPALAVALPECGVWVEEETVLNDLLTDLGTRSR